MSIGAERALYAAVDEVGASEVFWDHWGKLNISLKLSAEARAELLRYKGELEAWVRDGRKECLRCYRCVSPGFCKSRGQGGCKYE